MMMAELHQCAGPGRGKEMTTGFILLHNKKDTTNSNNSFLVI